MTETEEKQIIHTKKESANNIIEKIIITAGFVLFSLLAISQLAWPYDRDQGIIGFVADKILAGGMPYKDGWDVKGPLPYYIYAFAQWFSNHGEWGIRVLDFLILSYGLTTIWYITKILSNSFIAYIVCFIMGSWYFACPYLGAQPDAWISILMTIMIALFFHDEGKLSNKTSILSGIILAAIGLTKPPFLLYGFIPLVYAILNGKNNEKNAFIFVFKAALVCVVIIIIGLFWLWFNDSLSYFIEVVFAYNWESHRNHFDSVPNGFIYDVILEYFTKKEMIVPFIVFFTGLIFLWKDNKKRAILITTWFVVSSGLIVIQGKYFLYHMFLILPVAVIFMACAFKKIRQIFSNSFLYFLCSISLLFAYYSKIPDYIIPSFKLYSDRMSTNTYYSNFGISTNNISNFYMMQAAQYIKDNNPQNNTIFSLGFDPVLYYWADILPPTRLGFIMPFIEATDERLKKYSDELVKDLTENRPEYIIIFDNDVSFVQPKTSRDHSYSITGFRKLIDDNYYAEIEIKNMVLYKYHNNKECYFDYPRDKTNNIIVDYWNSEKKRIRKKETINEIKNALYDAQYLIIQGSREGSVNILKIIGKMVGNNTTN